MNTVFSTSGGRSAKRTFALCEKSGESLNISRIEKKCEINLPLQW